MESLILGMVTFVKRSGGFLERAGIDSICDQLAWNQSVPHWLPVGSRLSQGSGLPVYDDATSWLHRWRWSRESWFDRLQPDDRIGNSGALRILGVVWSAMKRKRIAIVSSFYRLGQWRGIMRYGQEVGWICQRHDRDSIDRLVTGNFDGVLFQVDEFDTPLLDFIAGCALPCVGLRALLGAEKAHPLALLDLAAIGRTVATHFLTNNVRRFAYIGPSSDEGANAGCTHVQGMRQVACAQGIELECIFPDLPETWQKYGLSHRQSSPTGWDRFRELGPAVIDGWMKTNEPVGVLLAFVEPAMEFIELMAEKGVEIPRDVSIAAQTEDGLTGLVTKTPLTCVVPDFESQGYQAARLLDGILNGRTLRHGHRDLLSSAELIVRESSNQMVASDPLVQEMLDHIRRNALNCEYSPQELANAFGYSLRFVQIRFRTALNKGVAEMIRDLRTRHAGELLRHTRKPLQSIINDCGFSNHHQLDRNVKRAFGVNPSRLRREHHTSGSGATHDLSGTTSRTEFYEKRTPCRSGEYVMP